MAKFGVFCAGILLVILLVFGRDQLMLFAGPVAFLVAILIAAALVGFGIYGSLAAYLSFQQRRARAAHEQQMQLLQQERMFAEIEARRFQSRLLAPNEVGVHPAYVAPDHMLIQPEYAPIQQAVPHTITYSPHMTHQAPKDTGKTTIEELNVRQPTMDEVLSWLSPNGLQVCLGRSMTTGEPYIMDLIRGTHYEIIGGSGFGKSCFAAALLYMTTYINDPDHLQIALLDLEHKTSRLFEILPHVAQLQIGRSRRTVDMVATNADEVADALHWLKLELDRRKALSEYDLRKERFMLIYVEEFLSLKLEVASEKLEEMARDFGILALRGRKYGLYLMACAQVSYADKLFRDALNQFNVKASFTVKPTAAQAVGFTSYDLLKLNFAAKQPGQLVLETTGCNDLMLAPVFDVKQKLLELERSQGRSDATRDPFTGANVRMLNAARTPVELTTNDAERAAALARAVLEYKRAGWGKQATIEKVWGVTKGGSARYQQAESEYETIIAQFAQEA
jgi:hypothetical protein